MSRSRLYTYAGLAATILIIGFFNREAVFTYYQDELEPVDSAVRPESSRIDVEIACEIAIRDEVASPAPVRFPSNFDTERPRAIFYDDYLWRYTVPVSGQNEFGGEATETFLCVFDDRSGVVRSVESSG